MFSNLRTVTRLAATAAIGTAVCFASCGDDSTIGQSIAQDEIQVFIDSTFTLTGHTVENGSVRSRTIVQILGNVNLPGYGYLSSDVVTQFMPAISLDTTGVKIENIDSLRLVLAYEPSAYTGDSLPPMGIEAYRLTKDLPQPIFSDFNPQGYYDEANPLGSAVYSIAQANDTSKTARYIYVNLPRSLAVELYQSYLDNPTSFSSPATFSDRIFKGIYLRTSYGSGRVLRVAKTYMSMFYHTVGKVEGTDRDTTYNQVGNYFAVTPEIISNNNMRLNKAESIDSDIEQGQTLIVAPVGTDAEVVFPGREIISKYRESIKKGLGVINSLSMTLQVNKVTDDANVSVPPFLLLVLKKEKEQFFADNKIADNKTSFYAARNADNTYNFSNMRQYILDLLEKDQITDEDVTFIVTPVTVNTETSSGGYYGSTSTTVTGIVPFVSYPAMAKVDFKNTKITLVYSRQTINN